MASHRTKTDNAGNDAGNDARNKGFGLRASVVHHKPGFDHGAQTREGETHGNHRFRVSEQKDVPQRSLADRIRTSAKGA
jgi:hypothetical protein